MPSVRARQIQPVSTDHFTANGQRYAVLRFAEGSGMNLQQTIDFAAGRKGQELLTLDEVRAARDDTDSNIAFTRALEPEEWSYVRDQGAESRSRAAYLLVVRSYAGLHAGVDDKPDETSRVVVLKETGRKGSEAQGEAAPAHIPKQLVRDASRAWSEVVRDPTIDETRFAALGELVEAEMGRMRRQQ